MRNAGEKEEAIIPFPRPLGIHLVKRQIPQLPLDNRMKDRDGSQRGERGDSRRIPTDQSNNSLIL